MESLDQPHMEYDGCRITLNVKFGNMKDKVQVDIGIGDAVDPIEAPIKTFNYKDRPLFSEKELLLYVYPPETIFAEKLETIISKGVNNSRLKDYHDLLMLIRQQNFDKPDVLLDAIRETFSKRGTNFNLPLEFSLEDKEKLQRLWVAHIRNMGVLKEGIYLPQDIGDVLVEINKFLMKS